MKQSQCVKLSASIKPTFMSIARLNSNSLAYSTNERGNFVAKVSVFINKIDNTLYTVFYRESLIYSCNIDECPKSDKMVPDIPR